MNMSEVSHGRVFTETEKTRKGIIPGFKGTQLITGVYYYKLFILTGSNITNVIKILIIVLVIEIRLKEDFDKTITKQHKIQKKKKQHIEVNVQLSITDGFLCDASSST